MDMESTIEIYVISLRQWDSTDEGANQPTQDLEGKMVIELISTQEDKNL